MRKILSQYIICRKLERPCYYYSKNSSLTKLWLHENTSFSVVADIIGPLYEENIFDGSYFYIVYYTSGKQSLVFDVVQSTDSCAFITSF